VWLGYLPRRRSFAGLCARAVSGFEGTNAVTVAVGRRGGPDLSQTVPADDPAQRYRELAFLDLNPQATARVLVTTATTRGVVQPLPPHQ
jgi:hypothetical protein